MKPMVLAKSALVRSHLQDMKNRGAENIEVHLEDHVMDDMEEYCEDHINMLEEVGLKVRVVHAPINRDYIVDSLIRSDKYEKIRKVFYFADRLGKKYGEDVRVIMHMEGNKELYRTMGIMDSITWHLGTLLTQFRNVKLCVENSMTLNMMGGGGIILNLNNLYNTIDTVNYLNKKVRCKSIGTVIDICQVISEERLAGLIDDIDKEEKITMEKYFDIHKDTLEVIHLANCKEMGYGWGNNDQPFETEEDIEVLKRILGLVEGIGYKGKMTVEICEVNNEESINWSKTSKLLKELM